MIGPTSKHTYYLCDVAVDFRKGFNGLSGLVKEHMAGNPLDGCAYVFMNAKRNRIKILVWEGDGFLMCYKRLEKGTYDHPIVTKDGSEYQINHDHLLMILRGIKWEKTEKKVRYKMG